MSVTSESAFQRKRLWYLVHVLALVGTPTLVLFLCLALYVSWVNAVPALVLPVAIRGLLSLASFGAGPLSTTCVHRSTA